MLQPVPPIASDWNNLFNLVGYIALTAMAIVVGAMIIFAIKYREKKGQHVKFLPRLTSGKNRDAVFFASISLVLLLSISAVSYRITPNVRFSTADNLPINVSAFQWGWLFTYPNGVTTTNVVNLPENTNIMFNVTSLDVMHNFYLVEFHVSIDAIPGRNNLLYVTMPPLMGNSELNYTVRCKELCGVGHAFMVASLHVISVNEYNQWLSNQTASGTGGS